MCDLDRFPKTRSHMLILLYCCSILCLSVHLDKLVDSVLQVHVHMYFIVGLSIEYVYNHK